MKHGSGADEMMKICSRNCHSLGRTDGKRPLRRSKLVWEDNIKKGNKT
jgi:hypothetical protein